MTIDTEKKINPLISIVMPAYNSALYIEEAIRSVMNQTHKNWELIVIDDCSSDSTPKVVNLLAQEDSRIKFICNSENSGVARTRNSALDLVQGEYIAFLDSDDRWFPEKLSLQLKQMIDSSADISYTSYAVIDKSGIVCRKNYIVPESCTYKDLLGENVIGCSTVMMSSAIAKQYRFKTDFYHEDYCLWLNILRDGCCAVGCSEVLTEWRYFETSRSFNKWKSAKNRWKIFRDHMQLSLKESMVAFLTYALSGLRKYYG